MGGEPLLNLVHLNGVGRGLSSNDKNVGLIHTTIAKSYYNDYIYIYMIL